MSEFLTFQSFYSEEEALALSEVLEKNGIDTSVVKTKPIVDEVIMGNTSDQQFHVKIRNDKFTKANEILENEITKNLSLIGSDYYLYSFSNEELFEIIQKPDEWSKQDFVIAKKILFDRNIVIPEEKISQMASNRWNEVGSSEKVSQGFLITGYIMSLSGIGGIIFGLFLLNAKKILPDGNKVFTYDQKTRNHGKTIIAISCFFLISGILDAFKLHLLVGTF